MEANHFLLVGNGAFANRGCEAIVRGTMAILRREFGPDARGVAASFASREAIRRQAEAESDPDLTHLALPRAGARGSADWWRWQMRKLVRPVVETRYRRLGPFLAGAHLALEIGGDNYSLDYGWPEPFLALDRYLARRGVPVVLWGASVGPFDAAPPRARGTMFRHLAGLRAIFLRESASLDYLRGQGLTNVFAMADPAFAMPAREPARERLGFALPPEPIGLNLSPLLARFAAGGDRERWLGLCAALAARLLAKSGGRSLLLVPHVTGAGDAGDDFRLLQDLAARLPACRDRIRCLPPTLSAAETKGVIARCAVFAGARTHATIAALSSGVPTLSFAYSVKAYGLNQDVYGSRDYCVAPEAWRAPESIAARLLALLEDAGSVRRRLRQVVPELQARAYAAGPLLRRLLGGRAVRAGDSQEA